MGSFYPFYRASAGVPCNRDAWSYISINTQDGRVTQKSYSWAALPFHPPNFDLAISRLKRGGVVVIMASCIFELHQCDQYFYHQNADVDSHTPLIPLHWLFHSWSNMEAPENIQMNAWSFLFTFPRGVSPVWCWVKYKQFKLLGASSVSLFWVCSPGLVVVHLACITILRWVPSVGAMRKIQFCWRTHEHLVCWFFRR